MHTSTMRRRGQQNMAQIPDDHKTNQNENYLPVKNRIWKLNNRTVATSLFEGFSDGWCICFSGSDHLTKTRYLIKQPD